METGIVYSLMKWITISAIGILSWVVFRMWNIDVLARTIWGEARGEGGQGMEAVAAGVMNRFNSQSWFTAPTVAGVAMKRQQFSAWNPSDPNYDAMINVDEDNNPFFSMARMIAQKAVAGNLEDFTNGATHYHSKNILPPAWTKGAIQTAVIGNHVFYKGVA